MHTTGKTATRRARLAGWVVAAAAAPVMAVTLSATPAHAAAGGAAVCAGVQTSTSFATRCESDPGSGGFGYRAYVICTDLRTYVGETRHSVLDPTWSTARCPAGRTVIRAGRQDVA